MRVYPRAALRRALAGTALIRCNVTDEGKLADCRIEQESPTGLGFGQAALEVMPKFRMATTVRDGGRVGGAIVRLPLRFLPPQ